MPNPAAEPPALFQNPATSPGTVTLSTSLLGDLQVPGTSEQAATLQALSTRAAVYATRARGDGTRRTYRSAWRAYEAWCASLGRPPLAGDPETIAVHAADRGLSLSSLRVTLAAVKRRQADPHCGKQHQRLAAPIGIDQACRFTTWWKTVVAVGALDGLTEPVKKLPHLPR